MIEVVNEKVYKAGEDFDDINEYEVNAIYHPPNKNSSVGYYIIDFNTRCKSLKIAVKRFLKACKKDKELSTKVSDIVKTDLSSKFDIDDWYEWFKSNDYKHNRIEQQVGVEWNGPYDNGMYDCYLIAMLFEVED